MADRSLTRIATNLLGRVITKHPATTAGEPMWPVNDPMVFAPSFPSFPGEHKAEIVAAYMDKDGDIRLLCRTLRHGILFTVYAVHGHTVDGGK